ncbi:MAG: hypothetical protein JEZ09_07955 [Salinivirgaceae bacterium]|nr:hypothetical protein [Salinivirgaceae bacterium]
MVKGAFLIGCSFFNLALAISDALRNHQKKVINLMNEYPDNWPTIRNEFRPVKNIIENSKTR